jgi:hypothetical protein
VGEGVNPASPHESQPRAAWCYPATRLSAGAIIPVQADLAYVKPPLCDSPWRGSDAIWQLSITATMKLQQPKAASSRRSEYAHNHHVSQIGTPASSRAIRVFHVKQCVACVLL